VILGGQTAGDFPPESIALLAAAGHKICLDAQGLARGSRTGLCGWPDRPAARGGVTALKLNDVEAGASGPLTAPELLVTMASEAARSLPAASSTVWPARAGGSQTHRRR